MREILKELNQDLIGSQESRKGEGIRFQKLGFRYLSELEYEEAFKNFIEALKISKKTGDRFSQAITLHLIGSVLFSKGRYKKAKRLFERSLELGKEDKRLKAANLNEISSIYLEEEDYSSSKERLLQSLEIIKDLGDRNSYALLLEYLSFVQFKLGEWEDALDRLVECIRLYEEIRSPNLHRARKRLESIKSTYLEL